MGEAQKRFVMALAFVVIIFSLYVIFSGNPLTGYATKGSTNASQWLFFWIVFPFVLLIVLFTVVTLIERNRETILQRGSRSRSVSRNSVSRNRSARSRTSRSRRR